MTAAYTLVVQPLKALDRISTSRSTALIERRPPINNRIDAYEAKTKLAELPRHVQAAKRFTITNRGKPVAELRPSPTRQTPDAKAAIDAFQASREANPVGQRVNIKELIEESRE
jgi:antitoxin (DNA-binding transcriptional repressor) of toxin-antitoxin stability system